MKSLLIAIMFSLLFSLPAAAAELFMIHYPLCPYCQAFMSDVAPYYSEAKHGKALPLTIIDITIAKNAEWIEREIGAGNIHHVHGTPTFIIIEDGKEIGRVVGYSGKEWFYEKLDEAIANSVQGKE